MEHYDFLKNRVRNFPLFFIFSCFLILSCNTPKTKDAKQENTNTNNPPAPTNNPPAQKSNLLYINSKFDILYLTTTQLASLITAKKHYKLIFQFYHGANTSPLTLGAWPSEAFNQGVDVNNKAILNRVQGTTAYSLDISAQDIYLGDQQLKITPGIKKLMEANTNYFYFVPKGDSPSLYYDITTFVDTTYVSPSVDSLHHPMYTKVGNTDPSPPAPAH